ncbi:uncharacterized protein LOC132547437 isoform X2 [Ylistrum balloti]|uniref:uncharacterized protein LOC132547437 isoform X2 n=1 Tax=Ylistrum balloti TaxID=509963 RepID=UPI0029058F30|nr:uncharacterized protein LOC132547437 isoform X2 [Ylistrum balloti]
MLWRIMKMEVMKYKDFVTENWGDGQNIQFWSHFDNNGPCTTNHAEGWHSKRESQGTVYFSDDMSEAQEAVKDTLEEYNSLLSKLNDTQKQNVVRTIGLRMEELKAQQSALEESLKD